MTVERFMKYATELTTQGANTIELVAPDGEKSPHFQLSQIDMLSNVTNELDKADIDVSIWYPTNSMYWDTMDVFKRAKRLDHLFIPSADPGDMTFDELVDFVQKIKPEVKNIFPQIKIWISVQGYGQKDFNKFLEKAMNAQLPVDGIVFGPQTFIGLKAIRDVLPQNYLLRTYPDICHALKCQYPQANWPTYLSITHQREPILVRIQQYIDIYNQNSPYMDGFVTYSEGLMDDVNKHVYNYISTHAHPESVTAEEIAKDYQKAFLPKEKADTYKGIVRLESNWFPENAYEQYLNETLNYFVPDYNNWRATMLYFRASYDLYQFYKSLAAASSFEVTRRDLEVAIESADDSYFLSEIQRLRSKIMMNIHGNYTIINPKYSPILHFILSNAEHLYSMTGIKLSYKPPYSAKPGRGGLLDTIYNMDTDGVYLVNLIDSVAGQPIKEQKKTLNLYLKRGSVGVLGSNSAAVLHADIGRLSDKDAFVYNHSMPIKDDFMFFDHGIVQMNTFVYDLNHKNALPIEWMTYGQSMYETPAQFYIQHLDPTAKYRIEIVYVGDHRNDPDWKVGLIAYNIHTHEVKTIHEPIVKPDPPRALSFDIPDGAVAENGEIRLFVQPSIQGKYK
eukprot:CAMPEP_0117420964 /NCGR_PEP_ID=MMETSP0758-20121206/2184_1 /TAXON_ID=63605 /ORGANISM="Percolomonas cosmopolitus, Strain AE-1 (ATCC 50343)" /LENGTH=618 /DNA_ID=CAMNT_0005202871 /DNA_START=417 /DNA_END=2270 /DNA_ORIENTATION=-